MAYLTVTAAAMLCAVTALASPAASPAEPNVEVASAWWPEMENTWVPIGWKDHPLRFNVLYNGTLIAQPVRYPARGQGVQLTFLSSRDGEPPVSFGTQPYQLRSRDGGVGDQGWSDNAAPVLWTRWRAGRRSSFARRYSRIVPGGGPVKTGAEPLFAWIRLFAEDSSSGGAFVLVRVNQPHIQTEMDRHKNLIADPRRPPTRDPSGLESAANQASHLLLDDAAHVRLAVVSGSQSAVALIDQRPARPDAYVKIAIPAVKSGHVDLLVPLVPADREAVDAELALGRDAALRRGGSLLVRRSANRIPRGHPGAPGE